MKKWRQSLKNWQSKINVRKCLINSLTFLNLFQVLIDLEKVDSTNQLAILEHFNILEDLFLPGVFFHNVQNLDIKFGIEEEKGGGRKEKAVFFGNTIRAMDAAIPPAITVGRGPQPDTKAFSTRGFTLFIE